MSDDGDQKLPQVVEQNQTFETLSPRTRLRLSSVRECRRELAKLYAEARHGEIDISDATRLTYLLTSLANMIRDSELEQRIEVLEAEVAKRP